MHPNVAQAITNLQCRAQSECRVREGEVLEEALDDLVRNPDRSNDPEHLAGSAIARAKTKLQRRTKLAPVTRELDHPEETEGSRERFSSRLGPFPSTTDHASHQLMMARDAIARSSLSARDRTYLRIVSGGLEAADIAAGCDEPVSLVRVRLSRARSRAREIWQQAA